MSNPINKNNHEEIRLFDNKRQAEKEIKMLGKNPVHIGNKEHGFNPDVDMLWCERKKINSYLKKIGK